jgi:serine/threonine protein kinase
MQRTAHPISFVIDPVHIHPSEKFILGKVMREYPGISFFSANQIYRITDKLFGERTECRFTHNMLKHFCGTEGKHIGEERYEVIDPVLLGKGTYGRVNNSLATISVHRNGHTFHKIPLENNQRVIKEFIPSDGDTLDDVMRLAEYEYQLMRRMKHLHVKPPVRTANGVYLVMRKMPGINLYELLKRVKNGQINLTLAQRLKLSLLIAIALKNQVHDKNIMHRDLSTKNIIVDMKDDDFIINIIDLDLASDTDQIRKIGPYHIVHHSLAPEMRDDHAPSSTMSDIYSLARVYSEIFGFDSTNLINNRYKTYQEQLNDEKQYSINLDDLFKGIKDIDFVAVSRIINLLKDMGKYEPNDRASLEDVICILGRLYQEAVMKSTMDCAM